VATAASSATVFGRTAPTSIAWIEKAPDDNPRRYSARYAHNVQELTVPNIAATSAGSLLCMESMTQSPAVPAHIPLPAPAQVEPGIWSLPVPLPGSALRYVVP